MEVQTLKYLTQIARHVLYLHGGEKRGKENKKYRWNYKTFVKTCIFSLIIALAVWFCISYMDVLANNLSANEDTHSWNMIKLLFTKSL